MIERLELKNFTAFNSLSIEFSPKINVIIGENGTGKTHLLKVAYGIYSSLNLLGDNKNVRDKALVENLTNKFLRLFLPIENRIGKLKRQGTRGKGYVEAHFSQGDSIEFSFHANSKTFSIVDWNEVSQNQTGAVLIPTKEVLSLVKGMNEVKHDHDTVKLIFDDGYLDLANALFLSGYVDEKELLNHDPRLNSIIPELVNLIGGRFEWVNNTFCFQQGKYEERKKTNQSKSQAAQMYLDSTETRFIASKGNLFSSSMAAEGYRKIGILHRLLSNGSLNPGASGPLFWDEPESNMNPNLMKLLVRILFELARNGQQIILATHDYVLLKWFDILADSGKGDHIRYHLLNSVPDSNEVALEYSDDFEAISKSSISNTFAELYDEDVKRALG